MMAAHPAESEPRGSNDEQAQAQLELADALVERAQTLAAQADQLIAALDLAARRLLESGRGVEISPIVAPVRLLQRAPAPAAPAADPEQTVSEGIRLLITTMALAGRGHDEIAQRLREDFGFEDPDQLIKRATA
jgi:hypothetical protein